MRSATLTLSLILSLSSQLLFPGSGSFSHNVCTSGRPDRLFGNLETPSGDVLQCPLLGAGLEWVCRYNGSLNYEDGATAVALDEEGNVYVTGYSPGIGTDWDYATLKYIQSTPHHRIPVQW